MRHIGVMAGTGAIGLIAIFAVDLINLLYVSMLGEQAIAAAVGFAGVVGFFHLSLYIGLLIGITAVVSRTIGAHRMADARALATSSLVITAILAVVLSGATLLFLEPVLQLLGTRGRVLESAHRFLLITLPSSVLLGMGMTCSALLRSVGDARRAMLVTLLPAVVTAVLDPVFIFGLGLGLDGAAIVLVIARFVLLGVGLFGAWHVQKLLAPLRLNRLRADARTLFVVAGQATIDRLTPVAFGLIYCLSGAGGAGVVAKPGGQAV